MGSAERTPFRFYLYPLAIAAAVGGAYSIFGMHPDSPPWPQPELNSVEAGKDYYVGIALVELTETDPSGNSWDSLSESGPDVYVEIYWKEARIYQSTTKKDTFVAKWSNADLDIRDMAIKGGRASMDDVIRAARVNVKPGEAIEVRVFESDILGSVLAGSKTIFTSELRLGDTSYEFDTPGLKRLILRVTDMNEAVDPLR